MNEVMRETSGKPCWGIDLGGTKIEGVIIDPTSPGEPLHRLRISTEQEGGYEHILERISSLIGMLEESSGSARPAVIGVGTPGTTDPGTGLLKNSNTLCLNGKPLSRDLSLRLGCRIAMANDANCCALAEATLGAAKGHRTVFGIILGTGVGGGIVVDGKILTGRHGICGEWGHNPLCGEDTPCYCGRRGCLETVCSGPALERHYRELSGRDARLPEIVRLSDSGDRAATATMERLRGKFAEALGSVLNLLDPDAVVIGGGVGNLYLLYSEGTREAIRRYLFNDRLDTPLLRPQLGDSAGVFGAAMLTMADPADS
jgi:fructokinase